MSQAMLRKWPMSGSCRPWLLAFYVKKRRKKQREREVWEQDWLQRRWGKGAFRQLMAELRLEDEESYREYMRMDTVSFEVKKFSILL